MTRSPLQMSEREVMELLSRNALALIAGRPEHGLDSRRARYRVEGGDLICELVPADRVFALDRHPDVCVVVDEYPSYAEIVGVVLQGRAEWVGSGAVMRVVIDRVVSFDFTKI